MDAWPRAIEVVDESTGQARTLALFPEDRGWRRRRTRSRSVSRRCGSAGRANGAAAGWPDSCGAPSNSIASRRKDCRAAAKGRVGDHVLQVLASHRLIAPRSEWKLHRDWFGKSAMADLLGADFSLAESHKLYACHDRMLAYKEELFSHLVTRWRDLFNARFRRAALRPDQHLFRRARPSLAHPAGEIPAPARSQATPPGIEPWAYGGNDMS
jgi:hypothetical protein